MPRQHEVDKIQYNTNYRNVSSQRS